MANDPPAETVAEYEIADDADSPLRRATSPVNLRRRERLARRRNAVVLWSDSEEEEEGRSREGEEQDAQEDAARARAVVRQMDEDEDEDEELLESD